MERIHGIPGPPAQHVETTSPQPTPAIMERTSLTAAQADGANVQRQAQDFITAYVAPVEESASPASLNESVGQVTLDDGHATVGSTIEDVLDPEASRQQQLKRIQRELFYIWYYPMASFLVWTVFPLWFNISAYNDDFVENPPVWLATIASMVVALQCLVDCIIFIVVEMPHKHRQPGFFLPLFDMLFPCLRGRLGPGHMTGRAQMARTRLQEMEREDWQRSQAQRAILRNSTGLDEIL